MGTASLVYDPYDHALHRDPWPTYRRLRDEAPAYHNAELRFWALSRFDDVAEAFRDWSTFTSTRGVALHEVGDVQSIAKPALRHRIAANFAAQAAGVNSEQLIDMLMAAVPADRKYTQPAAVV